MLVIWADLRPNPRNQLPLASTDTVFDPTSPVNLTVEPGGPFTRDTAVSLSKSTCHGFDVVRSRSSTVATVTVTSQFAFGLSEGSADQ